MPMVIKSETHHTTLYITTRVKTTTDHDIIVIHRVNKPSINFLRKIPTLRSETF